MEKVKLIIPTGIAHACQIITGFLILKEQGWDVEIINKTKDSAHPFHDLPTVLAEYRGKKLLYDVWDGYQDPEDMLLGLECSDFYFKRSFSAEKNENMFPQYRDKIFPLGFNYHVTHKNNPINEPLWKHFAKQLLGRAPERYFVPEVFEGKAERNSGNPPKILFLTRLWDNEDPLMDRESNEERRYINEMRVEIIRTLRAQYGESFVGGLNDCELSRKWGPDLIMPAQYTERRKYLDLLHSCDICIGSMGLHQSVGWKTGEYVAAAKAVVNERMHYTATGDFYEGKNYLAFDTAQECVNAVQQLVDSPEMLYAMKCANEAYYRGYLKPEVLVKNSLDIVDRTL